MLFLRIAALLRIIAIGVSVLGGAFAGNRQKPRFGRRIFQMALTAIRLVLALPLFARRALTV